MEPPAVDATGCPGRAQAAPPGGVPWCPAATALLGIPGLVVTAVTQGEDGWTIVDVTTAPDQEEHARRCPGCGQRAAVKEWVTTTPRDILLGDRQLLPRWRKRRWACENEGCPRGTFTESLPAVPPRARLTARLRTRIGEAIGDDLMPAAQAARRYGVSDRTAAAAFTAYAGTQLADLRDHQVLPRRPGSTSSAVASPAPPLATARPARNGSPTWWTSATAAPSAWPRNAPARREKAC